MKACEPETPHIIASTAQMFRPETFQEIPNVFLGTRDSEHCFLAPAQNHRHVQGVAHMQGGAQVRGARYCGEARWCGAARRYGAARRCGAKRGCKEGARVRGGAQMQGSAHICRVARSCGAARGCRATARGLGRRAGAPGAQVQGGAQLHGRARTCHANSGHDFCSRHPARACEPAGAREVLAIQPSWPKGQPSWSAAPGREPARRKNSVQKRHLS